MKDNAEDFLGTIFVALLYVRLGWEAYYKEELWVSVSRSSAAMDSHTDKRWPRLAVPYDGELQAALPRENCVGCLSCDHPSRDQLLWRKKARCGWEERVHAPLPFWSFRQVKRPSFCALDTEVMAGSWEKCVEWFSRLYVEWLGRMNGWQKGHKRCSENSLYSVVYT